MSMITAITWVPRGYAATFPTKYSVDERELARISKLAKLKLEDANEDLKKAEDQIAEDVKTDEDSVEEGREGDAIKLTRSNGYFLPFSSSSVTELMFAPSDADDDLREYDLDHYDSDVVYEDGEPTSMFGNAKSLAYHESNADDPYITMQENEEGDEEREELQILGTDNMLVAAKVEDEVAHLEVYVYEDEADNLYVHHDIMLPAIPLCVEWLDIAVGKSVSGKPVDQTLRANFVAVGTFDPDIEIWDLDTVDCMYPNAILGQGGEDERTDVGIKNKTQMKKKRKKSNKANDDYHVDAVLALAANRNHRTLLASGSADKTIKLWDLSTAECAKSYSYHTDKVCSLKWHPTETTVLLSGSYDRTVVAADMRAPNAQAPRWGVESDVETVRWDPHDSSYFYITTENGIIHYHDARVVPSTPEASSPVWKLHAHDESISSFDINPIIPGFLVTGSTDKEVKLWNVQPSGPSMVVSRNIGVGKVFSTTFAPDAEVGFRLAVAGSKGAVQVWDTSTNAAIRRAFANRVAPTEGEVTERLIGVDEDSNDSEDGGGVEPDGELGPAEAGWETSGEED
ncbi:hypothetical protein MMC19_005673 [Ptychographa xylographoides]|nr:hypothetical protein [Ptychographa xylographoides]